MQNLVRDFKYSLRRFAPIILLALFLVYIYYHTISGERGFATWLTLSEKIETLKQENREMEAQVSSLQKDVDRLSMENPDIDYLDELARRRLAVAHPDEKIIIVPQTEPGMGQR